MTPMRDVAREHGTPIAAPNDVNSQESLAELAKMDADLLVVCDYGQILSTATLATSRLGGINLHASLLPRYRGAAPINWAIYYGETETGVSVIHMTPKIDAGPVIAQARHPRSERMRRRSTGIPLVPNWCMVCATGNRCAGDGQAPGGRGDAAAGFQSPPPEEDRWTGRLESFGRPRSRTNTGPWSRGPRPTPIGYDRANRPCDSKSGRSMWKRTSPLVRPATVVPGTVVEAAKNRLVVAAGQGYVLIRNIQPAGKRLLSVQEFLCGHNITAGGRMGGEEESGLAETGCGGLK